MSTIPPFGLVNIGASCHFNAILQVLMSCKYVVKHILETNIDDITDNIKRDLYIIFAKGLRDAMNGRPDSNLSVNLLRTLVKYTDCIGFDSNQQSSCEGFTYLVDKLGLEWFFEHKHSQIIMCYDCGYIRVNKAQVGGVHGIPLHDGDISIHFEVNEDLYPEGVPDDISDTLGSRIISHTYKGDGKYRCSGKICNDKRCPAKNHNEDSKCIGRECRSTNSCRKKKLQMIPEYLVVYLNKYRGKRNIKCPSQLQIPGKNNMMTYKHIGQIDHSGSLIGGHYYAFGIRDSTSTAQDCGIRGDIRGGIRGDNNYLFNDGMIGKSSELQTTSGTYMVFYELVT